MIAAVVGKEFTVLALNGEEIWCLLMNVQLNKLSNAHDKFRYQIYAPPSKRLKKSIVSSLQFLSFLRLKYRL